MKKELKIKFVDSEAEHCYTLFGDEIYQMVRDGEVSEQCISLMNANTDAEKIAHFDKYMKPPVVRYKSAEFKDKIVEKLNTYDFSLPPDNERVAEEWKQDGYDWRITKRIWNWKEEGDAKDSLEIYVTASKAIGRCRMSSWTAYVYLADAPTKYRQQGLRPYKNTRYLISV
jgi:hypothetical protein